MVEVVISKVTAKDAPDLLKLIRELAEYEKMPEGVETNENILAADINREAVLGFLLRENGIAVAMVLYYLAYSTWQGQYVHMEDLYVSPEYRRKGYGMQLWVELAKEARLRGAKRLQWNVLGWNKPAIDFYKTMPIQDLTANENWLLYRLDTQGIAHLADKS